MNDADAALLRQRDRQMRFRDRIHGRADDGNVQPDVPREAGARVGLSGENAAAGRLQKHVVESETFWNGFWNHARRNFYYAANR